jgi:hypothetical protein
MIRRPFQSGGKMIGIDEGAATLMASCRLHADHARSSALEEQAPCWIEHNFVNYIGALYAPRRGAVAVEKEKRSVGGGDVPSSWPHSTITRTINEGLMAGMFGDELPMAVGMS